MNYKPILIVAGEPNSVFLEIFFKSINNKQIKNPIILIASLKLLELQMSKLKVNKKVNIIVNKKLKQNKIFKNKINLINVNYSPKKPFEKISSKSNNYISNCFKLAFEIIKKNKIKKFINGPINKKTFLNKNYLGMTEYISDKFKVKKNAMLIYNKRISVCPITTHLPLKLVAKKIKPNLIVDKVILINNFYKTYLNKKPRIAVLGLNPHCKALKELTKMKK